MNIYKGQIKSMIYTAENNIAQVKYSTFTELQV